MNINWKRTALYVVLSAIFSLLWSGCSTTTEPTTKSVAQTQEVEVSQPTSLAGLWSFEDEGISFKAEVKADTIEIVLHAGDASGLYWAGTFPATAEDGSEILSKGDVPALAKSLFGSQDKTKSFTYNDGELLFDFTMMGVTKTVALTR